MFMYVSLTGKRVVSFDLMNYLRRHSSVVEHVIGNDGVVSPILTGGTINKKASLKGAFLLLLLLRFLQPFSAQWRHSVFIT